MDISIRSNYINGVIVIVPTSSAVDRGFNQRLSNCYLLLLLTSWLGIRIMCPSEATRVYPRSLVLVS